MVEEEAANLNFFWKLSFQLKEPRQCGAGGIAGEDALFARNAPCHERGVLVGHLLEMIDHGEVYVLREEVFANSLRDVGVDLVLVEDAGLLVLLEDRSVRVDAPDLDLRILLFQKPPNAADRTAGADPDNEMRDAPVGLIPDLRPGLLVMRRGIREIVVLV